MMDKIGNHNGKVLKKESEQRVENVNGVPEKCCRDHQAIGACPFPGRNASGNNP